MPGARRLAAAYGASRNTVRDALRLFVAEGLLVRRPGLGTRVAARKFAHSLDRLAGLAETLTQQGTIVNEVRAARWEPAPAAAARRLEIESGSTVLYLERLRLLETIHLRGDRISFTSLLHRSPGPSPASRRPGAPLSS